MVVNGVELTAAADEAPPDPAPPVRVAATAVITATTTVVITTAAVNGATTDPAVDVASFVIIPSASFSLRASRAAASADRVETESAAQLHESKDAVDEYEHSSVEVIVELDRKSGASLVRDAKCDFIADVIKSDS